MVLLLLWKASKGPGLGIRGNDDLLLGMPGQMKAAGVRRGKKRKVLQRLSVPINRRGSICAGRGILPLACGNP